MIKGTVLEEIEYFQSLSYDKKLKYFDDQRINFLYETHRIEASDLHITIRPSDTSELKQYNLWIVNHWRKCFHDDLLISKEIGNIRSFKYYDELKEYYFSIVLGIAHTNKMDFIKSEIESVGMFVTELKISRLILSKVYADFQNHLDDEIYPYSYQISNSITKLKAIAKVVDIIKYRIFLRSEQKKYSAVKTESKTFAIEPLTNEQLTEIFDYLLFNGYIDSATSKEYFLNVFTNQSNNNLGYIKWIDKSQNNNNVNKLTLISLIDILVGEYTEDKNRFIKTYFKLYQLKKSGIGDREIVEITNDSLKQSRKIFNKQNVGKEGISIRQVKIMDKIKSVLTGKI